MKTEYGKDTCPVMFTAVLFITAKIWKQLKYLSVDKWMKTLCWTYVYNRTLFIHEKKEILPLATTWMKLDDIMLSEIS